MTRHDLSTRWEYECEAFGGSKVQDVVYFSRHPAAKALMCTFVESRPITGRDVCPELKPQNLTARSHPQHQPLTLSLTLWRSHHATASDTSTTEHHTPRLVGRDMSMSDRQDDPSSKVPV